MSERSAFKKPARPEAKPFQVSVDLKSGINIGLGVALVQLAFVVVQLAIGASLALLFGS